MSFFAYYFNIMDDKEETAVCCPFPHTVPGTQLNYMEQNPSAHVNLEKGTFHCKACGKGYSEAAFIKEIFGCSYNQGVRLAMQFKQSTEDLSCWIAETTLSENSRQELRTFGIADATIDELNIRTSPSDALSFPVFMYNKLLDIRQYRPNARPKVMSRTNALSGLIIPFDLWRTSPKNKTTIVCAGEKDMANARSRGFNAITITGGENALPIVVNEFKDRNVVICYDNDAAGKTGAARLADHLQHYAKSVKICTGFHEVCKEDKEDITDFFVKYRKTREDLIQYLKTAEAYTEESAVATRRYPVMDLHTASQPNNLGRMVRSNIQVVAVSDATFMAPEAILAEKKRLTGTGDTMYVGELRSWELSEDTVQDLLHMIDNNFKESDLDKNYRHVLHILQKEKCVKIKVTAKQTVYKCYVTDMFETTNTDVVPMEYTVYAVGTKLESGKKYLATYKLVPHPYKGQQLVMLITDAQQASDSVSQFRITEEVKAQLNTFTALQGTVAERATTIVEKFKGILGYDGNNTLIQAMDLAYHTPVYFNLGRFKNERAYLDTLIVGESRMGKSSTADAMRTAYGLGTFTSLAGNAATIPGLVGGSNKTSSGFQTRAGIIPQNHKGLIIFEELGKSNTNVLKELTDIRSSNEVRIARVSGSITLPATVRMITLTNVKTIEGVIKPIAQYPNGISILTELVGTAEDIARYDLAVILGDRGPSNIDPFWQPEEPFDIDVLRTRVRWIWSRSAEQISITEEVAKDIIEQANRLNSEYSCHIKIFGTEAWKKVARVAVAIAGYLVSTDETYENIVVTKEHVEYAANFLRNIYDNDTFKLKEYVVHERKYSTIDADGVALLQDIYIKAPAMLLHLEQAAQTTKNTLQAATGMTNDEYNAQMNRLVSGMFVTFSKYDIIPTERFRLGMARIQRTTRATRVGEPNAT